MRKFLSVFLAALMVFSTVSSAVPMAVTVADTVIDAPAEPVQRTEIITQLSADDWFNEDYGTLVAEVDFNTISAATTNFSAYSEMNVNNLGGRVNSALSALTTSGFRFRNNIYSSYTAAVGSVVVDGTNRYISYTGPADTGTFQQWMLTTTSGANSFVNTDGNFVVTADLLLESDAATDNPFNVVFNHTNGDEACEDTGRVVKKPVKGSWSTIVAEYGDAATLDKVANSNGYFISSITEVNQVKFNPITNMGSDVIGIDNIRLYWLPKTVNITVDMSELGLDDAGFDFGTIGCSAEVLVEAADLPDVSGYIITGLSKTKGGEAIGGDYIRFTQDTTLYPVYEKDPTISKYGNLVVNFDFDKLTANTDYSDFADKPIDASGRSDSLEYLGGTLVTGKDYIKSANINVPFFHAYTNDNPYATIMAKDKGDGDIYLELTAIRDNPLFGIRTYSGYPLVKYINNSGTTDDDYWTTGKIVMTADVLSASNTSPITGANFNDTTDSDNTEKYNHTAVCYEEAVLGTWSTIGVADTACSSNYNQFTTSLETGDVIGIDNVALWWMPSDTSVYLDNSEYCEGASPEEYTLETGYYTISDITEALMENGAYYDNGFFITGIKTAKDGEVVSDGLWITSEMTLYPVWEKHTSPYIGTYGELIFEVDFENLVAGTEFADAKTLSVLASAAGGTLNTDILGTHDIKIGFAGGKDNLTSVVVKEDTAHGKYIEYTIGADGGNNNNVVYFSCNGGKNAFIDSTILNNSKFDYYESGQFIFEYDLLNGSDSANHKVTFSAEGILTVEGTGKQFAPAKGAWGQHMSVCTAEEFGSNDNGTITSLSQITRTKMKLDTTAVSGDTFAIDNVKLWWVPSEVKVSVDFSADEAFDGECADIVLEGYKATVENLIAAASDGRDFAGKIITGLSYTKNGEAIAKDSIITSGGKLYAIWGLPNILSQYSSEFTNKEELNAIPASLRNLSSFSHNDDGYITFNFTSNTYDSGFEVTGLGARADDVYIPAGSLDYMEIRARINADDVYKSDFATEIGTANFPGMFYTNENVATWGSAYVGNSIDISEYLGEWHTFKIDASQFSADTTNLNGIRFDFGFGMLAGTSIDIDYIRFIGKETVKQVGLTIDFTDIGASGFGNRTTKVLPGTVSVSDLMAQIGTEEIAGKVLVGLSLTEGGDILDEETAFTEDTTLYCVWQSVYRILDNYSSEFTSPSALNSTIVSSDSKYTGGKYTRSFNEDGYLHFEFNPGEGKCVYNPFFVIPGLGGAADDVMLAIEDLNYVELRVRVNGFEAGTFTDTDNTSRTSTATQSLPYFYFTTDETTAWGNLSLSDKCDVVSTAGQWQTIKITADRFTAKQADMKNLNGIRFDLPATCNNGSSVDIDYIRFVGFAPQISAPASKAGEYSLRFDGSGATYNGVRFKASVTSATDKEAVDIGWVISSYDYWVVKNGKEMTDLDVTDVVSGSSRVQVAYKRVNGTDPVQYFNATDDEALLYTAVVYNISPENYEKKIIMRPFVSNGSNYYYGEPMSTSMFEVATAIKNNTEVYESLDADYKNYINDILGLNEQITVVEGVARVAALHADYNNTEVEPRETVDNIFAIEFDGDMEIVDMSGNGARNDNGISFKCATGEIVDEILVVQPDAPLSNNNYDPQIYFEGLELDARRINKLTVCMKRDYLPNVYPDNPRKEVLQAFFTTSKEPSVSEEKSVSVDINDISDLTDWFEVEFEFSENEYWADTITSLRFDTTNNNGIYYIDWMIFEQSDKYNNEMWYDMYFDYAVDNGIMEKEKFYYSDYTRNITKAEMCDLITGALPESHYTSINDIKGIPDVLRDSKNADVYLMLYKAGVYLGDSSGNFNADASVTRLEALELVDRALNPANRLQGSVSCNWSQQGESYDIEFDDTSYLTSLTYYADSTSIENGALVLTPKDDGENAAVRYDPRITIDNLNFNAVNCAKLQIRMKVDYIGDATSTKFDVYFKNEGDAKFTETKSYRQSISDYSYVDPAGWYVIEADLRFDPEWKGDISAVRFDPGNTNAVYTIDYIRFANTDPYFKASHEELTANGFTSTELLSDEGFENGFYVAKQDQSVGFSHGTFTDYVETGEEPSWGIAPWWSLYDLIENRDTTTDKYTLKDDKGINTVIYNPDEKSISMRVDATKVHNGEPHYVNHETWWPHLLLEQNSTTSVIDKQKNTAASDKMFIELDMRITDFKDTLNTEGENQCGYFAYFYLMTDKAPGQKIYFGLNLLGKLTGSTSTTPTFSPESAGNQYMYRVPQAAVFDGVENSFNPAAEQIVVGEDWKHLRVDVTHHIERAVEWANSYNAFGTPVTIEDMYFGGGNIGFEVLGNYDCTVEIKNFNMIAYNK